MKDGEGMGAWGGVLAGRGVEWHAGVFVCTCVEECACVHMCVCLCVGGCACVHTCIHMWGECVCEFPGDEERRHLFPHQLTILCVSY